MFVKGCTIYELCYVESWRRRLWLIICVERWYVTTKAVFEVSKRYRIHYNYGHKLLLSKLTGDLAVNCFWILSLSCCCFWFLKLGFCIFDNDWNSSNWQVLVWIIRHHLLSLNLWSWNVGERKMWWEVVVSLPLVKF